MTDHLHTEEDYIISESSELNIGENPNWLTKLGEAFPAFKSKNYTLYFYGQLISLIGTWLQIVAQGWLVLQLTNSAFLIGLVAALGSLPSLVLSLFGGVIVDRFPKKYILIVTQSCSMTISLLMGILAITHVINIYEIMSLTLLSGIVNAIDIPARQSYVVELVNKDALSSAIALNSGIFNAARVIGPSVAGLLIALIGTGGAFIIDGLTYIAVITALFYVTTPTIVTKHDIHPLAAIKEGIQYSYSHPIIRVLLIFTGVVSVFGWSYTTIMPYIAKNTFNLDAAGLGYLYAATGLGALIATLIVSAYSKKVSALKFILGGNALFAAAIFLFTFTHSLVYALPLLFFAGLGLLSEFATLNTTIQHMVEDSVRGRVMSIYTLMFLGLTPVGSFVTGFLAEKFSPAIAIQTGAVIVFIFGVIIYLRRNNIRSAHARYQEEKS